MSTVDRANSIPDAAVGQGRFRYRPMVDWERKPAEIRWTEVAAVAVDSQDRVYVFNRGDQPLLVFDRDGRYLHGWGAGQFTRPHGITIGPDDALYLTDDMGHTVSKYTPEGNLLLTLGAAGQPSNTGATSMDF